ncbi:metal ABC transporter permease [Pasteuria penetrans]|uniref:metal ABC transporter permease n=1 Tax=Pasteuria penetrans TaxID=86005 RepID=UPI001FE63ABE|nr:metal ABC transporter permease [Pasteuria penetrans]
MIGPKREDKQMDHTWILLTGATVAATCGLVGCFLLLRKMAMLGDAIGHAILFGIAASFCLAGVRHTPILLIGATLCGWLTGFIVEYLRQTGVQNDAAISVTFTTLFATGVLLISLFAQSIDLDLDCVLFGEIAYVPLDTWSIGTWEVPRSFIIMIGILCTNLLFIILCYHPLKVSTFDPLFASALGIPTLLLHHILIGLTSLTTVAAFESVGIVLVISMLILPAATAYMLTQHFSPMLLISMGIGIFSSVVGYWLSLQWGSSIAGTTSFIAGACFLLALCFSPRYKWLSRIWERGKSSLQS